GRASGVDGGTFGRAGGAAAGVDLPEGLGADFGAITSDARALASDSDSGGSGTSSPFCGRSTGNALPDGAGAAAAVPAGAPSCPFPPSRDVFLPCLAMAALWRLPTRCGNDALKPIQEPNYHAARLFRRLPRVT